MKKELLSPPVINELPRWGNPSPEAQAKYNQERQERENWWCAWIEQVTGFPAKRNNEYHGSRTFICNGVGFDIKGWADSSSGRCTIQDSNYSPAHRVWFNWNTPQDKSRIEECIKSIVIDGIKERERKQATQDEINFLKELLQPVFSPYLPSENKKFFIETSKIRIEYTYHLTDKEYYWRNKEASITIDRAGNISEPMNNQKFETQYLSGLQLQLAEFQPIHDELLKLAEEIKSKLPAEYFKELETV